MGNLADYVFINRNIHDSLHKSSFLTNFFFARIQTQVACCSFLHKFHNIRIQQSLTVWIQGEEWVSEKRYRIKKKRHGSDNMFCNARVKVPQNQTWMIRFHILDFSEIWSFIAMITFSYISVYSSQISDWIWNLRRKSCNVH